MKIGLRLFILGLVFLVGSILHDTVYIWAVELIRFFSGGSIGFFGKLMNIVGVPSFGLLMLMIPLYQALLDRILGYPKFWGYLVRWTGQLVLIAMCFVVTCFLQYLMLRWQIRTNAIDFQNGATHLGQVHIFWISAGAIAMGSLIHLLVMVGKRKGQQEINVKISAD